MHMYMYKFIYWYNVHLHVQVCAHVIASQAMILEILFIARVQSYNYKKTRVQSDVHVVRYIYMYLYFCASQSNFKRLKPTFQLYNWHTYTT